MAYVPDEAVDRLKELSKSARHFYVYLARCRNQKNGKCCPSVRTTMEYLDCARATVFALRSELETKKWALFDGDNVTGLLGFSSPTSQTAFVDNKAVSLSSPESWTNSASNAEKSRKLDSEVQVVGLNSPGSWTAYKEEPAKEPAKEPIAAEAAGESDSPANKKTAGKPKPERKRDLVFDAITDVCRIPPSPLMSGAQQMQVIQARGKLQKANPGIDPDVLAKMIRRVGEWWATNWRGKNGQPPRPSQIGEVWVEASPASLVGTATTPATVNGVRIDPSLTAHDLEIVNGRPRIGWQRQWDRFPTARKTPEMAAEWAARYGIRTGAKVA